MKNKILSILITILALCTCMFTLTACSGNVEFKINFVVEGEVYATVNTSGTEVIKMPENPTKEDYNFDGWFWDKDVWGKPFTANSLLDAPLSSDMSVYAKFTQKHEHDYIAVTTAPTCTQKGFTTYTCSCNDTYIDNYVDELGHSYTNYVYNEDAKCEVDGTETAVCNHNCGKSDTRTKTGTALTHEYSQPRYVWNDNQCTATRVCSHNDTHIETETATGTYVKDTDATCTTAEKGHYEAMFTHSAFTVQATAINSVENGKELGHSFTNYNYNDNANCETDGTETAFCDHNCGQDYTRIKVGSALEHVFTNYNYNDDAKCEVDGTETAVCNHNCGESDTRTKTGTALMHEYGVWQSNGNGTHTKTCKNDISHKETKDCNGGTATCQAKAVCVDCNTEYGSLAGHVAKEEWSTTNKIHYHDCETQGCTEKLDKENHTFNKNKKCTVCEYVTTALLWTEISSDVFEISGTNLYVKVPNNKTSFYFGDVIEVAEGATYRIFTDVNGTTEVSTITYTSTLVVGDNTFYIVVSNSGSVPKTYVTTIRRRPMYEVAFNTDGGAAVAKQTVEEDFCATAPMTTKDGYEFTGWDYDFTVPITKNTTITASWKANEDTKYIVEYFLQNLKDDNYTLDNTRSYQTTGTTDTTASVTPLDITHFTLNEDLSVLSGNIDGKGDLVLKVYYTRDSYTITTEVNNAKAGTVSSGGTYKFDKEITVSANTNDGYTFLGWFNDKTKVYETEIYTFNVNETITLTAKWSANTDTKYIVEYYLQNLNDNNYTLDNIRSYQTAGTTDTTASVTPETIEHFTLNSSMSILSGNIDRKGNLVLKVYYTRNTYTITTDRNNVKAGTVTSGGTYKFDKGITVTASTNDGYTFLGWYNGETKVYSELTYTFNVSETITLTAKWSATIYNIEYELNGGANNKDNASTYTVETATFTLKTPTKTGYIFDGWYLEEDFKNQVTGIELGSFGGVKVYAKWTPENYTVTYNYGYAEKVTTDTYNIETSTFNLITPTRDGYTFNGWYLEEIFNTKVTQIEQGSHGDITFYAKWNVNQYTLTIVYNNGQNDFVLTQDYNSDIAPISNPTKTGYTFTGWDKTIPNTMPAEDLTINATWKINQYTLTIVYNNGQANKVIKQDYDTDIEAVANPEKTGYTFAGWNKTIPSKMPAEDLTVTANWDAIEYDIVYNLNKGNLNTNKNKYTIEQSVIFDNPTRDGYTFGGWYNNADFNGEVITVITVGAYGDIELYAKWTPENYTVTYNYGYAEKVTTDTYNIETSTFNLITPTRDGYTFNGWYLEDTYKNQVTEIQIGSYGNKVYYAKWTANTDTKYVVEYYLQNLEDDNYTLDNTRSYQTVGTTDKTAAITPETIEHFTINQDLSALSGNIDGKGSLVLSVYYTRNIYTLFKNISSAGSVTNLDSYKYGTSCFESTITSINVGYYFVGWYAGETLLSTDSNYTFTVTQTVMVKFEAKTEMLNFNFTSSTTTCSITGIKDKTVTEIYVPNYVTSISNCAFDGCSSLISIEIPNSVRSIDNYAFDGCSSLTSVNYLGAIDSWVQIDFGDSKANPLYYTENLYLNGSLFDFTNLELTTATKISNYVFYGCTSLTSIAMPNSVTSIGNCAFYDCTSLTSIVMPNSVTSIGNYAFYGCTSLSSIVIPNSVTSIGNYAFYGCTSLSSIVIPNSVISMGGDAFFGCSNLTSVIIEDGVTCISSYAFGNCFSLATIEIPETVVSIFDRAFYNCDGLKTVTLPNSLEFIYGDPFDYCYNIENVTMPSWAISRISQSKSNLKTAVINGGTNLKDKLFSNFSSLTSVVIGDSVTSIGNYVFYNCSKLTSVVIPDSVTSIGESVFYGCSSLEQISMPFVVDVFGYLFGTNWYDGSYEVMQPYSWSYTYPTYHIPSSLKSATITSRGISHSAFYGISSLKSVTIGDKVTSMGNYAFDECTGLTKVNYTGTIDDWAQISFGEASNPLYYAKNLYINDVLVTEANITTATKINSKAFFECDSLRNIVIGDSVTVIGSSAFYGCSSLMSVTIGNGVTNIGGNAFHLCSKLIEIVNKSTHITITKGSYYHGYVGYYALAVYNSDSGITESQIINDNGYVICPSGKEKILIGYKGVETDLTLPSYITQIKDSAFADADGVTSIVIGNNVTSIGRYAFEDCNRLTSVRIGDNVTTIGDYAFYFCNSLTSVVIPNSVTIIGDRAFYGCGNLTSVTIGDSVKSIGEATFCRCISLTSVVIPNSVTSVGEYAFADCDELTSVTIGNSVTSIGRYAFASTNLKSVTFRDTSTWYITYEYNDWLNKTGGTNTSVTSASSNAAYFKSTTYRNYYWYKK